MDRRNCQKVQVLWLCNYCSIFFPPHTYRHTVYQGYPLCPPTCCQKTLASYQWAVSRNGHGIQSKDWKMLTAKGWLSANVFSDVNPGELICENMRTLIHIWGCGGCLDCWLWGMTLSFLIFHCGFVLVCICVFLRTGFFFAAVWKGWGRVGCSRQRGGCLFREQLSVPWACLSILQG